MFNITAQHIVNTTKFVVGCVVWAGAATVVDQVIDHNIDRDELSDAQQYSIAVGTFAIGGMVATSSAQYTDDLIDTVAAIFGVEPEKPAEIESICTHE